MEELENRDILIDKKKVKEEGFEERKSMFEMKS